MLELYSFVQLHSSHEIIYLTQLLFPTHWMRVNSIITSPMHNKNSIADLQTGTSINLYNCQKMNCRFNSSSKME